MAAPAQLLIHEQQLLLLANPRAPLDFSLQLQEINVPTTQLRATHEAGEGDDLHRPNDQLLIAIHCEAAARTSRNNRPTPLAPTAVA